ncbi:MAG: AsmA family protein [Acidobacteriota bacterium]|nr:AsmA family protein [Acidobacteriota bacterium]
MTTGGKKSKAKVVAAALAVVVFAVVALPFLLDADQFRPQIETWLSGALGRQVKLGKMRLALFSGGLSVDDISIADGPGFSAAPFVTADALDIGVELAPLVFSKKVHITSISLDRPSIVLRRSAKGEWNFADLGAKEAPTGKAGEAAPAAVAGVSIDRLTVTGGRVEIVEGEKAPAVYEKVNLSVGAFSPAAVSPFTLSATLPGGGTLGMTGTFGPMGAQGDMMQTPLAAQLAIDGFDLVASGYVPADAGVAGLLDFSGDLNSDGKTARSKGKATASNLRLAKGGENASKPVTLDYDLGYDLKGKTGALSDATVTFGAAALHLGGAFDASGDATRLRMKLKGGGVPVEELQAFLPALGITLPKGASLQGGTLDMEITAAGALDDLTMDGAVAVAETRLAGFDLGGKLAPVAKAAGLKSNPDTLIEKLGAGLRWTAQGVAVNDIQLVMPDLGELSGAGTISPRQELDFAMRATVRPAGGDVAALTQGRAIQVTFFVQGDASDPKFIPDYKDAVRSILGSVFPGKGESSGDGGKGLTDALKGIFKR